MRGPTGRTALLAAVAALAASGCQRAESTRAGGKIAGETLTIYSLLPQSGPRAAAARDIVDGHKLALAEAGGLVGGWKVNFVSLDLGADAEPGRVADVVREAIGDPQMLAAIADLDSATARTSIPLLNAAGMLHVSPGATYSGFVASAPGVGEDEPQVWHPAGAGTFWPLLGTDVAQAVAIAGAARRPVLVEEEAGDADAALAAALRERLGDALTDEPRRARTVVYVGDDPASARGVVESLLREAPRARILLTQSLASTGLLARLGRDARGRVAAMHAGAAVSPESAARFEARFGRCASRWAAVGYDAMRRVLDAIEAAGPRANRRAATSRAYAAAAAADGPAAFVPVSGTGCPTA